MQAAHPHASQWGHGPARYPRREHRGHCFLVSPCLTTVPGSPILACSSAAQFHRSAPVCSALGESSNISHFCSLAFGAFVSPLVFILFNFLLSFVCMPSWCSWQVSEMPKSELVDLMPVQCWSWYITKTEKEALRWQG